MTSDIPFPCILVCSKLFITPPFYEGNSPQIPKPFFLADYQLKLIKLKVLKKNIVYQVRLLTF